MPMWLAVAITVVVAIPFGAWLGAYSLPLFVSFSVWGLYFVFGAKPAGLKILIPSYAAGGFGGMLVQMLAEALIRAFGDGSPAETWPQAFFDGVWGKPDVGLVIAYFVGFCVVVGVIELAPLFQQGTLAYYSGIALTLGCIFIGLGGSFIGNSPNLYVSAFGGWIISVLAMLLGSFLGWLSVTLNGVKDGG